MIATSSTGNLCMTVIDMIELSNLRKYNVGANVRLEATIKFLDVDAKYPAATMYFETRNGNLFATDTYDAFFPIALYLAMYHKTPLRIRGKISKKLCKNVQWYIQKILCDFSGLLAPVEIIVDGYTSSKGKGTLIGTGISCGVDSLATIHDRFVKETDRDYRINALFIFNCGSHGDFDSSDTQVVFKSRVERAAQVAKDLKLPLVTVDTNLHRFRHANDKSTMLFLSMYSCVLSLQGGVKRYYIPSGCSYQGIKDYGDAAHHNDLATACDSYLIPLIQTERIELIVDGCQRRRVDKIADMTDWDIARKYLNVCLVQKGADTSNCGRCSKCLRTMLALEILGKLEDFAQVFNLEEYEKDALLYKARCVDRKDTEIFYRELVDLAAEKNFPMPVKQTCYVLDGRIAILDNI